MKRHTIALAGGLVLLAGACKDNPAAPSTDAVVAGSPQTLQTLLTGVVAQDRATAAALSYYAYGDIMARDAIRPDQNEPRWVVEFYEAVPDPSDFIGGSQWNGYYTAIRAAKLLMADPTVAALPAAQQSAAKGFLRTVIATDYIRLIEYHDQNGAVIQSDNPTDSLPIRTKQAVLAYTSALLDTAVADLKAAGSISVPFTLPPGYKVNGDYSQVANLILYNRGLKGKVEVYRALDPVQPHAGSAAVAKAALDTALSDAPGTPTQSYLNKGPYFEFNPASPESYSNPEADVKLLVDTNFVTSILPGDARAAGIVQSATSFSVQGYGSKYRMAFTDPGNTANLTRPLPILRNAELYLLRAQAKIALGDIPGAASDINVVHTVEGGLAPAVYATAQDAINGVLYEYRYSFILQGPQHIAAIREYGGLTDAYVSQPGMPSPLRKNPPSADAKVQMLPIPRNEQVARGFNITPVP